MIWYMFRKDFGHCGHDLWAARKDHSLNLSRSTEVERAPAVTHCRKNSVPSRSSCRHNVHAMPPVVDPGARGGWCFGDDLIVLRERHNMMEITQDVVMEIEDICDYSLRSASRETRCCFLMSQYCEISLTRQWSAKCLKSK